MFNYTIDGVLGEFKPTDLSVCLVKAILKVIPGAPAYVHYRTLDDAVRAIDPNATAIQFAEARALANDSGIKKVLLTGGMIDTVDSGIGVLTGAIFGWNLLFGDKSKGFENDREQGIDAALKALGLGCMVWHAYPGTVAEKAAALKSSPAGQTLLIYYGVTEIALPFADNAMVAGGSFVGSLLSKHQAGQEERLAGMLDGESLAGPMTMLQQILKPIESIAAKASRHVLPLATTLKQYLPSIMANTDKAAGVVASGVDMLPVYRLLSARLAAESTARRALGKFDPISPITITDDVVAIGAEVPASDQASQFFTLGIALIAAADVQLSSQEQLWLDANFGAGASEEILALIESRGLDGIQRELQTLGLRLSPEDKHWLHCHAWQLGDLAGSDGTAAEEKKGMAQVLVLCGWYNLKEPVRNSLWKNRSAGAA